jgi:radical SAM superfamily enzyme YgiQ (UPF0313 family)
MTSQAPRSYALAHSFKQTGAHVVIGGYHPSLLPDEALLHADTIIKGEAELAWPAFLEDFAQGRHIQRIYQSKSVPPESIPVPYRDVMNLRRYAPVNTIMASRGCCNSCSFCAISKLSTYKCRNIDAVIDELRALKRGSVIFFDPNFFCNRSYVLELMRRMEPLKLHWAACATVDIYQDAELLKAAKNSGCTAVLIGFESLNTNSLNTVNKSFNDTAHFKQAVQTIQSYGININGSFVLGLDSDTEEELLDLPSRVADLGLNLAIFFILTPLPGTEIFAQLEQDGRILSRDWSRYTQADVVYKPANIDPKRLAELYDYVWQETYRLSNILKRVHKIKHTSLWSRMMILGANIGFKYMGKDQSATQEDCN